MSLAWALVIVLAFACLLLLWLLVQRTRGLAALAKDLERKLDEDTNTLLDVGPSDSALRAFASSLNRNLKKLRELKLLYDRGDQELKAAVTNMSHDIRTPLTAMMGYLELLSSSIADESLLKYIDLVKDRALAIKALTDELLSYSISNSATENKNENVNLASEIEQCILEFYGSLKQRHIEPQIELCPQRVVCSLDKDKLRRILSNLVSNALKYSDGDLFVSLQSDGVIRFVNTARCLDAVSVGKLFDRFFTVQNAQASTGLGLSIAKTLTQRIGGQIDARLDNDKLVITLDLSGTKVFQ